MQIKDILQDLSARVKCLSSMLIICQTTQLKTIRQQSFAMKSEISTATSAWNLIFVPAIVERLTAAVASFGYITQLEVLNSWRRRLQFAVKSNYFWGLVCCVGRSLQLQVCGSWGDPGSLIDHDGHFVTLRYHRYCRIWHGRQVNNCSEMLFSTQKVNILLRPFLTPWQSLKKCDAC